MHDSDLKKIAELQHRLALAETRIGELEAAERALQETEIKCRALFESIDEGFTILEVVRNDQGNAIDLIYREANRAFERITGYKPLRGARVKTVSPDLEDEWLEFFSRVALTGVAEERESFAVSLNKWLRMQASRIDSEECPLVGVVFEDVTERKRAEQALRESEERQRLMLGLVPALLWSADPHGEVILASEPWKAYTGQRDDEVSDYGWLQAIHPDDVQGTRAAFERAFATGEPIERRQRIRSANGDYRSFMVRHVPGRDEHGVITRWFGAAIDVQDMYETQERQEYLLALSDALRPLADPEAIQAEAMRLLGTRLRVSRAQYYLADETGEYLSSQGGYTDGVPAAVGRFRLIEFGKYAYDGFHAGETQVVCDAAIDPRISEAVLRSYRAVGFLAYIGVPFVLRGRLIGTLAVHQAEPREWTESERMLVEETAQRAGIFFEQARAELQLREERERQAFLLRLSDTLRPLTDGVEVQRETTQLLGEHLGVDRCYYFETDYPSGEYIIYRDYRRGNLRSLAGRHAMEQWPEMTAALSRGEVLVVNDYAHSEHIPPDERQPTEDLDIRAIILVPLVKGGSLVACMAVIQSAPREWKQSEISTVVDVAERTWAAVESARAEKALRESEERFQQFAHASASGLWIRQADTLAMEFVSSAISTIYGVPPHSLLGDVQRWASLIVPEEREAALQHLEEARKGNSVVHEFRIQRPSDGAFRWIRNTDFPLHDDGHVQRIGGIAEDVSEAKIALEHQGVLLAELQHRVRNIMAIIRSITARTAQSAGSVEEYATIMSGRLLALGRVQALLTRAANADVSLRDIVQDEVSAQAQHDGQYELIGTDVPLSPKAAEVLTLAVHELATNALKYGALSVPHGKVTIAWRTVTKQDASWLSFDWSEEGAPVQPQSRGDGRMRRGFGSELIEGRIPYELRGTGRITIAPGGAHCQLDFPLREGHSVLETGAPQRVTVFGGALDMTGEADLSGHRVVVVEDEYYLATDIVRALRGARATVGGPCPDAETAQAEIDAGRPDAVVVDINLGQGPSFKLATRLQESGIPFVFLTGYDGDVIPSEFRRVVRLQKPVELHHIVRAIANLLLPS